VSNRGEMKPFSASNGAQLPPRAHNGSIA